MTAAANVLPMRRDFMRTDLGNAERFAHQHGHRLHYLTSQGVWLLWDGRRWAVDETGEVMRLAKDTVRRVYAEASKLRGDGNAEERAKLSAWAVTSEGASRLKSMVDLARNELTPDGSVMRSPADFDADPWLLNVANGVLDLRTAKLLEHDRTLRCRKLVDVEWNPEAKCDRWEAFIHRVLGGHRELVDYVQRAVGYSLTGITDEQCLFFLHGMGANGKSTFLETVRRLCGAYAAQADFNTLAERKSDGPRNDIARLDRTRLVTASELGEGKRLNEELVKSLTGGETVTARFLHKEHFEFKPEFKLWLAANHKPTIRGTDDGIWRRIRLIPFEVQIPEHERDQDLQAKLAQELPGILAWAVAGCLAWRQRGLWPPPQVARATQSYREESDVLGQWIAENCDVDVGNPQIAAPATVLFQNYRRWADRAGEYPLAQSQFGRRLDERGHPWEKRGRDRDRIKWRIGIRLNANALEADTRTPSTDGRGQYGDS